VRSWPQTAPPPFPLINRTASVQRFEVLHSLVHRRQFGAGLVSWYLHSLQNFLAADQADKQPRRQAFKIFGWHPPSAAGALPALAAEVVAVDLIRFALREQRQVTRAKESMSRLTPIRHR
jgi:hypothetical protein